MNTNLPRLYIMYAWIHQIHTYLFPIIARFENAERLWHQHCLCDFPAHGYDTRLRISDNDEAMVGSGMYHIQNPNHEHGNSPERSMEILGEIPDLQAPR